MSERPSFQQNLSDIANNTNSLKVIRYFPNADLRCGHDGLRALAREHKVDPWALNPGEFLVFANKSQTKLKIYGPGNLIAYLKAPDNRRLDLHVVRLIPKFFKGGTFQYDDALKDTFMKRMKIAS